MMKRVTVMIVTAVFVMTSEAQVVRPGYRRAEILLSEVDDSMYVQVNGQAGDTGHIGGVRPWIDVTRFLHDGENTFHVRITNEGGGPCGGRLRLRFNGQDPTTREWSWSRPYVRSEDLCVDENVTFWQYATPPANFEVVEIRSTAVDDTLRFAVNGQVVDASYFGYVRPWVDISKFVHRGQNTYHIHIGNEHGGACGARVSLRVNGIVRNTPWYWHRDWAPSEHPCVEEDGVFTLP